MKDTNWSIEIEPTRGEQLRVSRVARCLDVETQRTSYLTASLATSPRSKNGYSTMPTWDNGQTLYPWPLVVARAGMVALGTVVPAKEGATALEAVWQALREERVAALKAAAQAKAAEVVALLEEIDALQPRIDPALTTDKDLSNAATLAIHRRFPTITKAALAIAYDNGKINREEPEADFLLQLDSLLGAEGTYEADLLEIEAWLAGLTTEQLDDVCCGEDSVAKALVDKAPPHTDGLLNDIFELDRIPVAPLATWAAVRSDKAPTVDAALIADKDKTDLRLPPAGIVALMSLAASCPESNAPLEDGVGQLCGYCGALLGPGAVCGNCGGC